MKAKPPLTDCPKCDGTGKIEISPAQFQALVALRTLKKGTATELWMRSDKKLSITAWNNRLEDLVRLKLIKREGWKPIIYSISP